MYWSCKVGSFTCSRGVKCGRLPGQKDCGLCGMPELGQAEAELIRLYGRCKDSGCLPYSGGVLDQPARLMEYMDVISDTVARFKKEQAETQTAEAKINELRQHTAGHSS